MNKIGCYSSHLKTNHVKYKGNGIAEYYCPEL